MVKKQNPSTAHLWTGWHTIKKGAPWTADFGRLEKKLNNVSFTSHKEFIAKLCTSFTRLLTRTAISWLSGKHHNDFSRKYEKIEQHFVLYLSFNKILIPLRSWLFIVDSANYPVVEITFEWQSHSLSFVSRCTSTLSGCTLPASNRMGRWSFEW
jgi:hypothetical protein